MKYEILLKITETALLHPMGQVVGKLSSLCFHSLFSDLENLSFTSLFLT